MFIWDSKEWSFSYRHYFKKLVALFQDKPQAGDQQNKYLKFYLNKIPF